MPETPNNNPLLIREIPRIARYSRHNENEDYSFRAFLKGNIRLSVKELDAAVRDTTQEVWAQIDCLSCGNCCRSLQIVVDDADIRRLATRLGMTAREFSRKYVAVGEGRTKYFRDSPPCPFLGEGNACTVYEDRPQACRDYPYLHESNIATRSLMMIESCSTCPIVFNVWQRLKDRTGFRRRGRRG